MNCGSLATADAGADTFIELTFGGGGPVTFTSLWLYPASGVAEWRQILATAHQQLGGVSSGLGFFGSPEWVFGAAAAAAVLEGIASSVKVQDGKRSLRTAETKFQDLRRSRRLFPVGKVLNLDLPQPAAWVSKHEGEEFGSLGEDFLSGQTDHGADLHVRWLAVTSYRAIVNGRAAEPPASLLADSAPAPAAYFMG